MDFFAARRLLGAVALWFWLVSAFFGVHTAGVGYDDDDPNRISLVSNYPRSALNDASSKKVLVQDAKPSRKPVDALAGLPGVRPSAWLPPRRTPDLPALAGPGRPTPPAATGCPRAPPGLA